MKKNKGFLVYELVVAFSIVSIIGITLISTTFILKNKSDFISIETLLVTNKALLLKEIKGDLANDELLSIEKCGNKCVDFIYTTLGSKRLIVDTDNNTIEYGLLKKKYDKNIDLTKQISITTELVENIDEGFNNAFIIIKVPIYSKQLEKDYGINIIYQYDDRLQTFNNIIL